MDMLVFIPTKRLVRRMVILMIKQQELVGLMLFNENLGRNVINENNNIQGSRNQTETGTNNTYIMGEENIVRGVSRNNVIVGSNNQINYGVNNASILGNYGLAQRPGEAVIGGGGSTVGKSQSSTIHLSGRTEDAGSAAATSLYVNGDSTVYYYSKRC